MLPNDKVISQMKESSKITLGEVDFFFTKTVHKNRLLICSFLTKHAKSIESGNLYDMVDDERGFEKVTSLIEKLTLVGGSEGKQIAKHDDFWEDNSGIYLEFIIYAMTFYSLPFMKG